MLMSLQLRGRVSAEALAREFEVSPRTVYRDVDALSAAGVPIYAEPGRNGGIALHDGYRTKLTGLTPSEAAALPIAGLAQLARDLGVSIDARSARVKMLASLPRELGEAAERIASRFHIDPLPWYHRAEAVPGLPDIALAVWHAKRIAGVYEGWGGAARRQLDPLGLVNKGGHWYLVAAWRKKPRTYRVSNFRNLEFLDSPARRPARFDLAAYWDIAMRDFETRLFAGQALVRISEEGERILRAVMPAGAEMVAKTRIASGRAGWHDARLPFETAAYSARQLLRLGTDVEVVAPDSLRQALIAEAEAVVKVYARARRTVRRRSPTAR
ncbi:MAG: YafY family transcriptional regulator [Tagaea sp.]|nr:YafY family transcriptional regulator [Tagaea sp.]